VDGGVILAESRGCCCLGDDYYNQASIDPRRSARTVPE
jgi:hypothetical protein